MFPQIHAKPYHDCEPMHSLTEPLPYFYLIEDCVDTTTQEKIELVMLAIPGEYAYLAVHVDYCPWCGAVLTKYTRARSQSIGKEQQGYIEYLKRWTDSGQVQHFLPKVLFQQFVAELAETRHLVKYRPDPTNLQRRIKVLEERLLIDPLSELASEPPLDEGSFNEAKGVEDGTQFGI